MLKNIASGFCLVREKLIFKNSELVPDVYQQIEQEFFEEEHSKPLFDEHGILTVFDQ